MVAGAREQRGERREEASAAALWLRPLGAGLLYSLLTTLAFPGFGLWPLALVAPAPLIWAGWRAGALPRPAPARGLLRRIGRLGRRPAFAAWLGSAAGVLPLWLYQEQWTAEVTRLGYMPMCVTLALLVGLAPAMLAVSRRARATEHAAATADRSRTPALPSGWLARRRGRCSHQRRQAAEAPTTPSREEGRPPYGRLGETSGRRRVVGGTSIAWAGPVVWTGAEVFRGEVFFTGYPWLLAAHPLIEAPGIPHLASIIGAYGVSGLAVLPVCLAMAPGSALIRAARAVGALAIIALAGFGARALAPAPADRPVRVAVVQTNIPQDNKIGWPIEDKLRDFARFLELTGQAARSQPDLIVWPETMFPGFTLDPRSLEIARAAGLGQRTHLPGRPHIDAVWFADTLLAAQAKLGIPMLVGAIAVDDLQTDPVQVGAEYNSAFVLANGQITPQRYDKVHLTPFGEVMPYISNFPALENALLDLAAGGMTFGLSAGASAHGLTVPIDGEPLHVATPICFEAASGPTTRRLAAEPRAHLLVNITNDGWFGDFDPARRQAAQIARWRAIELATPMVRAANTGISIAYDARGRPIRGEFAPGDQRVRAEGVLVVNVSAGAARPTLFARFGWTVQWLLFACAAGLVLAGLLRRSANTAR